MKLFISRSSNAYHFLRRHIDQLEYNLMFLIGLLSLFIDLDLYLILNSPQGILNLFIFNLRGLLHLMQLVLQLYHHAGQ